MAIEEQDVTIPKPLGNGTTDVPEAGSAVAPSLPEGYTRVGDSTPKLMAPPLPTGYTRATGANKTESPAMPTGYARVTPSKPAETTQATTPVAPKATGHVPTETEKHDEGLFNKITDTADQIIPVREGYQAARGLYHGVMGDEESDTSKGQTTTASPVAANLGLTPEHIGYKAGEMGRGIASFGKEAVKDISSKTPIAVPDEKGVGISDPKAHTLLAKYVTAPSQAEREASQDEMQKYFEAKGPTAAGHAISAFLHGTLGEYVPMIGPLVMSLTDQAAKGDLGGALAQVASLYALEKGTGAVKEGLKGRIESKVADLTKTPEVKQAETNVAALAKDRAAAQANYDAAMAEHNKHAASHAQGIGSPEKVVKEVNRTKTDLDEATAHHEFALEDLAKKKAAQPTLPQAMGTAAGRVASKVLPTPAPAPEIPTEEVEAAPVLSKLGTKPETAPTPALSPINTKTPGQVQPETLPQTPVEAPRPSYGRIALAGDQGTMGTPRLLTEGTPEGPKLPEGGLPKIKLPEPEAPKAAAPSTATEMKALKAEGGKVVDKESEIENRIGRLLQEALKPAEKAKTEPVATEAPTENRGTERRVSEELPEGQDERRKSERRVLQGINERTFQESAFGTGGEKGIDTDAYAKATEQARKELGPDATKEAVMARRNELVAPEAKGSTGDIGAKSRESNPEPTRAETKGAKPALPEETPTGYAAKKEEVVPAGEEGRTPAKSAEEYHPAVEQKVNELSDDNLRKLAKAHGLNPDEYDFNARDDKRHRIERDQLAKDIVGQIGEDEKINLGRAAEATEKQGLFQGADTSAKGRAARAEKMFPRLRGPVDEFGNPTVSGGAPHGNVDVSKDKDFSYNGVWHVKGDGFEAQMYRDPASTNWYETGGDRDKDFRNNLLSTGTKEEAIKSLAEKHGATYEPAAKKTGFSQKADQRYPSTVGTAEGAKSDNEHFANAKKELGPDASISQVAKRAQEMKDAAAKPMNVAKHAADYNKAEGLPEIKPEKASKSPRVKEIADEYAAMKHDPENPEVKRSYKALVDDVKRQWDYAVNKMGIKIEPTDKDPYGFSGEGKPAEQQLFDDVNKNKRIQVWRGGNELPADHPLAQVDPKTGETYNTMFRAVHDIFGHVAQGHAFDEPGEESAWNVHRQMMSPEAVPAMTTETRGQTSWFFNHGGTPGEFAEQKAGLLPDFANAPTPDAKATLDHIKAGKDYAVLTAENPNNERATPEENAKRNRALVEDLRKKGYEPVPIEGNTKDVEGQKEHSYFVPDISPKDAAELGRKHGQAAVLTTEGLHDLKEDTVNPSDNKNILTGEEARKQPYYSKVGDTDFSVPIDFNRAAEPGKAPLPTVSGGSGKLPTGDALIKKYGESSGDPKDLTFILKDGRGVANTGSIHDEMLGGKATDKNPPREQFVAEGNIRVRPHQGKAGREVTFSIPESGVTPDQLKYIQKMSPQLRTGTVTLEVGKPGGDYKSIPYGEATPEAIESAVKELSPQPRSVGSARAGTSLAKESPLTPKQLQERLPDLAQQHLTPEEKESVTATATGKPRSAGTAKFIQNMTNIPTVREYTDIALQGEGARKWYSRSAAAFDAMHDEAPDYFKKGDKEKFMGVLAGSSPQQAVVNNLRETLGFWKEWNDAGRPKLSMDKWKEFGEEADKAWKDDGSPRAGGLAKGASQHWDYAPKGPEWKNENLLLKSLTLPDTKVPNIIKALNGEPMWPDLTKNAAFKAPSFAENLRKWIGGESTGTKNVTNDSWMGLFGGIDKSALSKPENYHPLSVATRAAAEALGWEPEEAQAAIWSFTQALTEKGVEDPEIVRHYSEDFQDLLKNDGEARDILEKLGVNLEQLDARLDAIEKKPEVSGRSTPTTSHSVGQLRSRIEEARGKGAIPEPKAIQGSLFRENPAFENRSRLSSETAEDTSFDPNKFRTQTGELETYGKKKSPFGKLGR